MNDPSLIALSAQVALLRQTDMLANNLANLSTNGFKGEEMVFSEYLGRGTDGKFASFVQDLGTARDTRQGPLAQTGNPLDVAIQGSGYLVVDTPVGPRYTRDGHFQIDAQNQIVTSQGYVVQSDANTPIVLPDNASDITIGRDGSVVTSQGVAGKLQVVSFNKEQAMLQTGTGLYTTNEAPQPATGIKVIQGALEGANVQPVLEITHLIEAQRAVSYAKDFIDAEASRTSTVIDRLGKLP